MELRTPRLVLQEFRAEDVAAISAYQSQAAYWKHNSRRAPTHDEVVEFVELMLRWRLEVPRTRFQLVITLGGRCIGTCGVRRLEPDGEEAEFGCELAPETWGHGYAQEASAAILDFGFKELGLKRIYAQTQPGNVMAFRLAKALGFRCSESGYCELLPP